MQLASATAPATNTFGAFLSTADAWGTAAAPYKLYYQLLPTLPNQYPDTVGVSASFYGNECINPQRFPKDPS
jgi:hypothetical protein